MAKLRRPHARIRRQAARQREAATRCERSWLREDLIQRVASLPDPLPCWAKKIWEDFLHHVQEEQNAFKWSSDSKGIAEAQPLESGKGSSQEGKRTSDGARQGRLSKCLAIDGQSSSMVQSFLVL